MTPVLPSSTDVLIIGAGPAGLVLGRELQLRNIPCVIAERGDAAGESWRRMPTRMNLVSPWKTNWLTGAGRHRWPRHAVLTREEYLGYLRDYATDLRLPVHPHVDVQSVERQHDTFLAQTLAGPCRSRCVVSATGYFSHPFVPEIPGRSASPIPQMHTADYGDVDRMRARLAVPPRPILILGQGLSAGQIMVELVEAGFPVILSHRSPIRFGSGPLAWWFLFRLFPALEAAKLAALGQDVRANKVLMEGGKPRRLIESGGVPLRPAVARIDGPAVFFTDGSRLEPGLILFATGFRPELRHLAPLALALDAETGLPAMRKMESADVPGLFFLGLEGVRNFRSRFPRGMRRDAPQLAGIMAERMRPPRGGGSGGETQNS